MSRPQVFTTRREDTDYLAIYIPYGRFDREDHNLFMRAALALGENLALLIKKHLDYGPRNIADFGELGVLVRLNDKVQRLRHILASGKQPANEAIEDTWRDIANYGLIGYLVRMGYWPGMEVKHEQEKE